MTPTLLLGYVALAGVAVWAVWQSGIKEHLPPLPLLVAIIIGLLWVANYHRAAGVVFTLGAVIYVIEIAMFPWTKCGGCNGTGEQWSWLTSTFKTCRRCGGLKKRVRWGRRLWSNATDINEASK